MGGKDFVTLSQIIGQEKAIDLLRRAISREKMPHGYLFVGIPGVGKRTTARALVRALNCREQKDGDGCGRCTSCRQIMGGNFPDFEYIEPDGQKIKIDQIRALNQALAYKPAYGRFRVTLIHQAETMTREGANAFLKTLEEPPARNILILCVAEPLDLLPTILSRCQKVRFRPIPSPIIAQWIDTHYDVPHDSAVLAGICEGSLGRAQSIIETDYLEMRNEALLRLSQLQGRSPLESLSMALEWLKNLNKKEIHIRVKETMTLFGLLDLWKTWYRDLLVLKSGGRKDLLIYGDLDQKLKKVHKSITIEELMRGIFLLEQAQRDVLQFRNADLILETTALALGNVPLKDQPHR